MKITKFISLFFFSAMIFACQSSSVNLSPDSTSVPSYSEENSAIFTRAAILEIVELDEVQVNWQEIEDDLVFAITYSTELNPNHQYDDFFDQVLRVVVVAAKYFSRTRTQAELMILMVDDINSPISTNNPPLYEIVIEKSTCSAWDKGEITNVEFVESWIYVPLPDIE